MIDGSGMFGFSYLIEEEFSPQTMMEMGEVQNERFLLPLTEEEFSPWTRK